MTTPAPALPGVDVTIGHVRWSETVADVETLCTAVIRTAFAHAEGGPDLPGDLFEVSILLADDDTVQGLNASFRGKNTPTNVLSFPALDDDDLALMDPAATVPLTLGDIVLALETLEREAVEQNKTLQAHFTHLLVHGFLHLIGYDHEEEDDAVEMETLEIRILDRLGITNPYEAT